jgi:RNA-directed DNA polymerase
MSERTTRERSEKSAEVVVVARHEGPNERESATNVHLEDAGLQTSAQAELLTERRGEASRLGGSAEASPAKHEDERSGTSGLMELVLSRQNLQLALKRVKQNKGSAGVDAMTVGELSDHLRGNWLRIREQLLSDTYQPSPVKRVAIPKPGGGERELGIPTVLDRFIQQAMLQVLQPRWDPTFSEHSHGFRPGRSAQGAVREAQHYVQQGKRWVVDVDLSKFFDRVNHDILMGKLAHRIADKRVLGLIRRYLNAGIMANGIAVQRFEGTPQGGPLSPLLANVLLDEVDKELEKRGHTFVRYADDCNVYVQSERAGERVMAGLRRMYQRLRLQINEQKSAVARAIGRKFLGFSFWFAPKQTIRCRVADQALQTMRNRVRELTGRAMGRSLAHVCADLGTYLRGWKSYFRLAETPGVFAAQDAWIRHRLRAVQLKHWGRGKVTYRELTARGMSPAAAAKVASNTHRWWKNSATAIHIALPNKLFDQLGLVRLAS